MKIPILEIDLNLDLSHMTRYKELYTLSAVQ